MRKKAKINRRKQRRTRFCLTLCGVGSVLMFALWAGMRKPAHAAQAPAVSSQPEQAVLLDAPFIDQREKYPTGCESVSAAMALQYCGMDITPDEIIDAMPKGQAPYPSGQAGYIGCDPRKAFPGDPYSEDGWGCYAPVVMQTVEDILRERQETSLSVVDLTGTPLAGICEEYLSKDIPVLIWATIQMKTPEHGTTFTIEGTDETFQWIFPMHCLLLVGADDSRYYFNDPMEGKAVSYGKFCTERAYNGLGRQALAFV